MEAHLYNLNIERAVLSSILFDPKIFEEVASVLQPKDFYHPFHQKLFEAMLALANEDQPIDEEFLKEKLELQKSFDEAAFLDILAANPLSNTASYVKEIKEKALKRELVHLTTDIKKVTVEQDLPVADVIDEIQSKLYKITTETSSQDFKSSDEVMYDTLQHLLRMKEKGNSILIGLDTGFHDLNIKTAGFNPGDLIIIAARPSMGKTAFALNLAQAVLDQNKGVVIFSLEMPAEQLMLRMLSAKASIPLQRLRVANLNDIEWNEISRLSDYYEKKKLFIDDEGNLNVHQLRAKLRKLKSQHPEIELAIIDYMQLMSGSGTKDRHLEISEISRSLKLLARELQIPIIALSQLNRSLESRVDKRPMLSDLRESGAIEQDADVILFVYRDDVYKIKEAKQKMKEAQARGELLDIKIEEKRVEEAEIIIGKQRNGPTGVVKLWFHKDYVKFAEEAAETIREYDTRESTIEIPDNIV
ncbi:replicative DNA helicase [Nitratiruptor tergarcus]|uniref:Replicative DNA helicase n=1 Tax=Nitratiruptor tergarcus DSM 16512 TaxID=1069081 RepID=A0A1W1WRQ8_9BACT|nr:replicative DNA helicase [Nitratiruptor tergarcus]SMC09001.1 replicative DNA helicase [Nitratiruptor tergarcus DSM 16512]